VTASRATFSELLRSRKPLVLPGAHDALSARLVQDAGFDAVYIGSYGTAAAAYALPDVGLLTLGELTEQAQRVCRAVSIPVLADAEAGFYEAVNIWRTVDAFERAGVSGIHIEDHGGGKHTPLGRSLLPLDVVLARLKAAIAARTNPDFKIIARTDAVWVLGDVEEAVRRMQAFAEAGADLVFPTGIGCQDLAAIRHRIPCQVLVLGDLPPSGIQDMSVAGADVIVFYGLTLRAAAAGIGQALARFRQTGDMAGLYGLLEDTQAFERRLGYDQYVLRASEYGS
jgi:methylisocitrate lyase